MRQARDTTEFAAPEIGAPSPPAIAQVETAPSPDGRDRPHWRREEAELWFRGRLVIRFHRPAANVHLILDTFERLGWPGRIPDPLPGKHGRDYSARLRQAVHKLKSRQLWPALVFQADGTKKGVRWYANDRP